MNNKKNKVSLKPCPFCAGEAEFSTNGKWSVVCSNCYAVGPIYSNEKYTKRDVIRFWNKRVSIANEGWRHLTRLQKDYLNIYKSNLDNRNNLCELKNFLNQLVN